MRPRLLTTVLLAATLCLAGARLAGATCKNGLPDGHTDPGEQCDDGNNLDCDNCHNDCTVNVNLCGDGHTCGTEQCDDANSTNCDGCDNNCTLSSTCGNGVKCGA